MEKKLYIPKQRIVTPEEIYKILESMGLRQQMRQQRRQLTTQDLYHMAIEATQALAYNDLGDFFERFIHDDCGNIPTMERLVEKVNAALKTLNDPYTRFLGPKETGKVSDDRQGSITGIGVVFKTEKTAEGNLVVDRLIEEGPAYTAGMRNGDVIVKVDGVAIANKETREVIDLVTGEVGTVVNITVLRDGESLVFDVTRGIIDIPAVRVERVGDEGNIAFLKFSTFMQDDAADEMEAALRDNADADGYIVGVRYNPGGQVGNCLKIASMFIREGVIVKIRQRIPEQGYQTTVYSLTEDKLVQEITNEDSGQTYRRESPRVPYLAGDKPVVFLTDKYSASASEMLTGAVKHNGAGTLIGVKTYGKGIGQTPQPLPGNTMIIVTSLYYYDGADNWFGDAHENKIGVEPDIAVENPEDAMPGSPEDKQLNTAIEHIESQL